MIGFAKVGIPLVESVFLLVGVLVGQALSFVAGWVLKEREASLTLRTMILRKRVEAHEDVVRLASISRRMNPLHDDELERKAAEQAGNQKCIRPPRYPEFFASRDAYLKWHANWAGVLENVVPWMSRKLLRELFLFQNYLVTLYHVSLGIPDEKLPYLGNLIRDDFVIFAKNIEDMALEFFQGEPLKSKFRGSGSHQYKESEIKARLQSTRLLGDAVEIEKLKSA